MTTPWADLPNAGLIDRVLADMRRHPQVWRDARNDAWDAAWVAAREAARDAARDAVRDAARGAAWGAARDAAWDAAWDAIWGGAARRATRGAAWDACLALVAWDDARDVITLPPDAVRLLVACGNDCAVLLLPAVIALNTKE